MKREKRFYEQNIISTLYGIKKRNGTITEENIKNLAKRFNTTESNVYKLAMFYTFPENTEEEYELSNIGPIIGPLTENTSVTLNEHDYESLRKALCRGPNYILEEVEESQLRGRGGAGFPTAKKWKSCRKALGMEKYLIANGHNGDPGSNSDRYLMTHHCHQLIEGMLIAAYAIGASKGIIYAEGEFEDSIKNLESAIKEAYSNKLLGRDILGSGLDFDISIFEAAGVYVCGESTALMKAIEGEAGEPRIKHIHTAEKGLFDKPTVLNNVETLINVPYILEIGAEEYAKTGTETSKGTKVFTLKSPEIKNHYPAESVICEVNMGTYLDSIAFYYGWMKKGEAKGVQIGGPLGGFIPADKLGETRLCFDDLAKAGAMMGDAITVLDQNTSIIESLNYFIKFLKGESCGKCFSCKETLRRTNEILEDMLENKGHKGDIELLEKLANYTKDTSLCQLGKSMYNPIHTAVKHFRKEFEERTK